MDCVQTSLPRETGLWGDMVMLSAAGHQQNHPFSGFPLVEEEAYAPADRGGLGLWKNFSVDDLLDLGSGVEQSFGDEEDLVGLEDVEEEEEEEKRDGSPNNSSTSAPSALSFQAPPPSSDLVVPAGDVAELEWVSRFVDDSYSEFPSFSVNPPFQHHSAPALPPATSRREATKTRFTSSGGPLKRNWGSCCFFTDSLVVPSKARSKRSRTGGRVWSLRRPPFLADSSSSSSCFAPSASSCSAASSSSSISPVLLYDGYPGGCPNTLQQQQSPPQLQMKKKRGRKPKAVPAGGPGAVDGAGVEPQPRRRCSHCGVDRTPQWRAGSMGAKTLCNACGVRYKSGRLLPEYRPAGSPTFLSHLHSNRHRQVLEMRRSKELAAAASTSAAAAASSSASCSTAPPHLEAAAAMVTAPQPHGVV